MKIERGRTKNQYFFSNNYFLHENRKTKTEILEPITGTVLYSLFSPRTAAKRLRVCNLSSAVINE